MSTPDFSRPSIYALDFGTSNSLVAGANEERVFAPVPLDPTSADPTILRSVLYFPDAQHAYYGSDAIRRYTENGLEGRLLRSIKKHLPSRSFHGTYIDDRPMLIEDLVAAILREMRVRADRHYGACVDRVVLGRPARFSEVDVDDRFAEHRLEDAAKRAGFSDVHFLPEPVAAARDFGAAIGDAANGSAGEKVDDHVVLVCDFGGGTSDFTVMRFGRAGFEQKNVLAIGGVAVAGDALDASIMRTRVARNFGAEVSYRVPLGSNVLTMPKTIVEHLCSPANLSILRRQDVAEFLRNVRSWSLGPDDRNHLDQLRVLVDDALGFSIFEAIEQAKRTLSIENEATVAFTYSSAIDVLESFTRAQFDAGAERQTQAILDCLDETLRASGLRTADVDIVCCTGGTAKVPRIADALRDRFGEERLRQFKSFHSVVEGLAAHARTLAAA